MKLNIGAGSTQIEGFTAWDIKDGHDARDLKTLPDDSVDEIRASHVLEHFTFADARTALAEWVRVLKPAGRMRIAVPDVDKCLAMDDPKRLFYLMGGQTDEHDIHKSAYDEHRLRAVMEEAGLEAINRWTSNNTDTASHPVSLNLEGVKASADTPEDDDGKTDIKITAFMTLPRYEAVAARSIIEGSLKQMGIGLATSTGVFWGQCMQRMFESAVADGLDWILTIDFDSLFNVDQLSALLHEFGQHPEADAMAALQSRRGTPYPLMTQGGAHGIQLTTLDPIKVTTAHFGLTLIRVEDLKDIPKPWFKSEPDEKGEYGDDRLDDDIWFWHQWRLAGKTIYVAPRVSIGHLEEMVACFDDDLQQQHLYLNQWREQHLNMKKFD